MRINVASQRPDCIYPVSLITHFCSVPGALNCKHPWTPFILSEQVTIRLVFSILCQLSQLALRLHAGCWTASSRRHHSDIGQGKHSSRTIKHIDT